MHKLRYILVLILVLQSFAFAQQRGSGSRPANGVLQGTVVDETFDNPVQYANVSVISMETEKVVTGGMTDVEGRFSINKIPWGRYNVTVGFMGYKLNTTGPIMLSPRGDGIEQNLGRIVLESTTLEMEAVEVQGEKPLYRQTAEMKVFNVAQSTVSTGGSALDALEQIPGIEVDIDGKVSLRGSTNVNILLDGRPSLVTSSDQEMVLEAIPANNILDIEIITNPSAKYDPEGMAGIINIVLKENKLAGVNGNISLGGSPSGNGNASGQVNYRTEKFNVFLNSGWRYSVRSATGDNYRETTRDSLVIINNQEQEGERGGDSRLVKTGFEFYPDKKNTVGINLSYSTRGGLHDRTVYTSETTGDSLVKYSQNSTGDNEQSNIDLSLFWDTKFERPRQTLSVAADISRGEESRPHTLTTIPGTGYETIINADPEKTTTDLERGVADLQLDYSHPINDQFRIESGYKGTLRYMDNDFRSYDFDSSTDQFLLDDSVSNHFRFDENIQAAYGQLSLQSGKATYQTGLRAEVVQTTTELRDTNENTTESYTSLYPSASFTLDLTEVYQLQSSYSRRVKRPRDRQLNPSVFKMDDTSIRMGNPYLQPEYTNVMELSLSRFRGGMSTSVTVYYRHTTDKISRFKEMREDGVTVMTYENFAEQTSSGLELTLSGAVAPSLRIMASGNLYSDQVDVSNLTDDYDASSVGYSARLSTIWDITPATEFMLSSVYRSKRDIPIGEIDAMTFIDMSLKRQFLQERLSVTLRASDLFDTRGFSFTTSGDNYYQESSRKFASQRIMLSLEYRFGKVEDQSRKQRGQEGGSDQNGYGIE
jgi:outer membrane receptor protein involved in Fe transport